MRSTTCLLLLAALSALTLGASNNDAFRKYRDVESAENTGGNPENTYTEVDPQTGELKVFECKARGEKCMGVPRCCGTLVCAWAGGLGFKKGECVECVGQNGACHRDDQCCNDLQCDKSKPYFINGICTRTRKAGADCFENSQCGGWCERELFHIWGKCMDA